MSNALYLQGRKKYSRPQALLFANNSGTIEAIESELYYVPLGFDVLSNPANSAGSQDKFMILSDDNRDQIDFNIERIEKRERMINGRMRSYHVADKRTINVSWNMLPSRAFSFMPNFEADGTTSTTKYSGSPSNPDNSYTSDGGAGGVEILDWYEKNKGSFWVYLAYDKYNQFGNIEDGSIGLNTLPKYNQVIEVFFSDFSYSVVKRGGSNYDFWNISLSLEEV